MRRYNTITGLSISTQLDRLAVASENPTVEVLIKIMCGELTVIRMGDVAAEDTRHIWIVLQRRNQIHQPHPIRRDGVLCDERDILSSGKLNAQVAGASMAEIFLTNPVQSESIVLR